MSKRVYLALTRQTDSMPLEYWRWRLVRDLHLTPEQVDALTIADFHEYLQVADGEAKAANSLLNRHGR